MGSNKRWIALFITFVIISLGSSCKGERQSIESRCDYDGAKIEPFNAVYFTLQDGREKKFCSITCASLSFPELKSWIKEVRVVDERSGTGINASQAFFVESEVVTVPHVKNRIHVFGNREDAIKHLDKFKGRWIENPFRLSAEKDPSSLSRR
jgi:ribosomal protein L24E